MNDAAGAPPPRPPPRLPAVGLVGLTMMAGACLAQNPDYAAPPGEEESATAGATTSTSATSTTATTATTLDPSATATATTDETTGGVCGDGVLDPDEACDDGQANGGDMSNCSAICQYNEPICGNGKIELGEECDDGNLVPGDGCTGRCAFEPPPNVCGDGIQGGDEACDDGNDVGGDGCEPECTLTPPGLCGDGVKAWDELCDDGNGVGGDGCEPDCTPTPEAICVPEDALLACDVALDPMDPLTPFHALGLACGDDNGKTVLIAGAKLVAADPSSWRFARGFGGFKVQNEPLFGAREGDSLLILSTGTLTLPDNEGIVLLPYNSQLNEDNNGNPDDETFLPGYTPNDDQGDTLQALWSLGQGNPNDKIFLSFKTKLAKGAKGYSLDLAVFSAEWPQFVDTQFSDVLVVWEVSEAFTGNAAVVEGKALNSTTLHSHWSPVPIEEVKDCATFGKAGPGYSCNETELTGTGFEGHAGTRWLRLNRSVAEGTDLELFVFLADMVDAQVNTIVLLDRLRVTCEACLPANDPACSGVAPDLACCGLVLPK